MATIMKFNNLKIAWSCPLCNCYPYQWKCRIDEDDNCTEQVYEFRFVYIYTCWYYMQSNILSYAFKNNILQYSICSQLYNIFVTVLLNMHIKY